MAAATAWPGPAQPTVGKGTVVVQVFTSIMLVIMFEEWEVVLIVHG